MHTTLTDTLDHDSYESLPPHVTAARFTHDEIEVVGELVDAFDRESAATEIAPDLVRDVLLPQGLLRGSPENADGLDVYHHMFLASVERLLGERLPAVREAVGEELFETLVCDYVLTYPAGTPDLTRVGASFPEYLGMTHLIAPDRRAWIAELAQLERAIARAATSASHRDVDEPDAGGWIPAPGLALLHFHHAIDAYYSAWQLGSAPLLPLRRSQWLAIYRQGSQVQRAPMTRRAWKVLCALSAGRPLAAAITEPFGARSRSSVLRRIDRWMDAWTSNGLLIPVQAS